MIRGRAIGSITGKPPEQFGKGRVCVCGAKISTYFKGALCRLCDKDPARRARYESGDVKPMFGAKQDKWNSKAWPDGCRLCPAGEEKSRRHSANGVCSKHYNTTAYHQLLAKDAAQKAAAEAVEQEAAAEAVEQEAAAIPVVTFSDERTDYVHGRGCGFQPGPGSRRRSCNCSVAEIDDAWFWATPERDLCTPLGVHIGYVPAPDTKPSDEDDTRTAPRCKATSAAEIDGDLLLCELPHHPGQHQDGDWVWEDASVFARTDGYGNRLNAAQEVLDAAFGPNKAADKGTLVFDQEAEAIEQPEDAPRTVKNHPRDERRLDCEPGCQFTRPHLTCSNKLLGAEADSSCGPEELVPSATVNNWFNGAMESTMDPEVLAIERVHDALAMLDSQAARGRVISWAMNRFELSFGG